MRILLDHNVPVYVAKLFPGHEVATAYRQGWAALKNGRLLAVIEEAGFELFVTLDKNIQFQQRIKGRGVCIVVLDPQGQAEEEVVAAVFQLTLRLGEVQPGVLFVVTRGGS